MQKKTLLVAATENEILPTLNKFGLVSAPNDYFKLSTNLSVLIGGIGMVETAIRLSAAMAKESYDLLIQAGIGGSLNDDLKMGEVVFVPKENLSELGAEDDQQWMRLSEMNLKGYDEQVAQYEEYSYLINHLKSVNGITVNRVHGNESSITKLKQYFKADVESMEGFSFIRCANYFQIPAIQIRAVSNRVEKRNRDHWNIGLAIKNLNEELMLILDRLDEK